MELFRIEEYLKNSLDRQIAKIKEELMEVELELDRVPADSEKLLEEMGDLLQASYTLLLLLKLDPEAVSARLKQKFIERGVL